MDAQNGPDDVMPTGGAMDVRVISALDEQL
jgi:hypothetical protein